jgi:hypothetical protein
MDALHFAAYSEIMGMGRYAPSWGVETPNQVDVRGFCSAC